METKAGCSSSMKKPISSLPFLVLFFVTLTGLSGCVSTTQPESLVPTVTEKPKSIVDTSSWTQESIDKGFVFSYPPELTYVSGGDVDPGSYSWVSGENPEDIYFEIFDLALLKCEFAEPEKCDIGTNVPATSDEVYVATIENFEIDDFYFPAEEIDIARTTGQKFKIREDRNDGIARTSVVFKNEQGVYLISDYQDTKNDKWFDAFLTTFQIE